MFKKKVKKEEVKLNTDEQEFLDQTDGKEKETKLSDDEKKFLEAVDKPAEPVRVYTEEDKKNYVLPDNLVQKDFYYFCAEDPGYGIVNVYLTPKDYFDKFNDFYRGEMDVDAYLPKGVAGNEGSEPYLRESEATTATTIRAMQLCAFNYSEKFANFCMKKDGDCDPHCSCTKHFKDIEQEMDQDISSELKDKLSESIKDYCLNHKDELNTLANNIKKVNKSVLTKNITKKDNWEYNYRQRLMAAEFYGYNGEIIEYAFKSKIAGDEYMYAAFVYTNTADEVQKVKILIQDGLME